MAAGLIGAIDAGRGFFGSLLRQGGSASGAANGAEDAAADSDGKPDMS